jgi:magnesium transporter
MRKQIFNSSERLFDWIDLQSPDEGELENLASELNIPALYIQDVLQAEHLPKTESFSGDESFFLIARAADPENNGMEFKSIREISNKIAIYYSEGRVISLHRRQFPWMEDLIRKSAAFPAQTSALHLVSKILKYSFQSFEPVLIRLISDIEFFESKLLESDKIFPALARSLYALKRKSSVLKQLFTASGPIREFLAAEAKNDPIAQDSLDMFDRINTLCEEANDRASSLINLNLAIAGQRNNDVMRFLTVYSAFFMPLTFLVGVYGMNFRFMPEIESPLGYPAVWFVILLITGGHLWWFRRKRWL